MHAAILLLLTLATPPKRCTSACYGRNGVQVCVYRESAACEAWETECVERPGWACENYSQKVADVDVVVNGPNYYGLRNKTLIVW